MKRVLPVLMIGIFIVVFSSCTTGYVAKPLPFRVPSSYENVVDVAGAHVAAKAYTQNPATWETFGFDILGAGMLPVQVIFDNRGSHTLEINGTQTFLEDGTGNLWPVLSRSIAYDRATAFAETNQVFREGAQKGFLGAVAGSIIGAAVGIVTGENVAESIGHGAVVGAAAGATMGGMEGMGSREPYTAIANDLKDKSLRNKSVVPKSLAQGFLFFPGEVKTARHLRLQLKEKDTGMVHILNMEL